MTWKKRGTKNGKRITGFLRFFNWEHRQETDCLHSSPGISLFCSMKRTTKWILGLGMLAFCLQMKPCPHGNCPAGRCLEDGPQPMGWQLMSEDSPTNLLPHDSLTVLLPDSLSHSPKQEKQ